MTPFLGPSMDCESCRKGAASIHYYESVNGVSQMLNLCERCASGQGVDKAPPAVKEALRHFGVLPSQTPGACPGCQRIPAQFLADPRFACPSCRKTFADIDQDIAPARFKQAWDLAEARWELDRSVACEDFEAAAKWRDQLAGIRARALDV